MLTFRTADGYQVRMYTLHLITASFRVWEPSDRQDALAQIIRSCVPESRVPVLVRTPPGGWFSPIVGIATFNGDALDAGEPFDYSALTVCWPVWHAERGLREIAEPAVHGLVWANHAVDLSGW